MNFTETNCTIELEGRTFESGGAWLRDDRGLVYIKETPTGIQVTDWHGNVLGTASVRSRWCRATRWEGLTTWRAYRVHLNDGSIWYGRHCSDNNQALAIRRVKG